MADMDNVIQRVETVRGLMRSKLGIRAAAFPEAMGKARHRLPRRLRSEGAALADAMPMAQHPKLRMTLDAERLGKAAGALETHLKSIDLADRRKGFFLGVLGTMAFNILLLAALLFAVLRWRGLI